MNEFKTYHPIVNFIYFVLVIVFSCVYMHPVCLLISFVSSFFYSAILTEKKLLKTNILLVLPTVITATLINLAFNHEGNTILLYLPDGNPLTLESMLYGISASVMIISIIFWFSCYNKVMTSDKFIYLFGRIIPSMALILSMTLRFLPEYIAHFKTVANSQKCIGRDLTQGSIIKRAKNGLTILSSVTTWALENSIETADSMKSRGYGLKARTTFSNFTFNKRDKFMLTFIVVSGLYIFAGGVTRTINFSYFPNIQYSEFSLYGLSVFVIYFLLCILPVMIEFWEVMKWKYIKSKI